MSETGTDLIERPEAAPPAVVDEKPGSLLQAIVTLAKDPSVDVAKLDALLQMQDRMEAKQAERAFAAALTRVTRKLPRVKKNGTISLGNNKGSIPFAKWEDIDKAIRPILDEEGFVLSFDSVPRADGGGLIVTATLLHPDGHSRSASMPVPLDAGPGRNNVQAMGSTASYGKRYATEMLLNIVREGDDDDGKTGGTKFVSIEEAAELDGMIRELGLDPEKFLHQFFEVLDVRSLEAAQFVPCKNMLLAKRKAPR